jgi:hypothetical protein
VKYFFTDPIFWSKLVFNGISPYQYRLDGPGSKPELARNLINTQEERFVF